MAERKTKRNSAGRHGGGPFFEARPFNVADTLRGNMESSGDKRFFLGLIFLEYISDSFEAKRAELLEGYRKTSTAPKPAFECRRMRAVRNLKEKAKQPGIYEVTSALDAEPPGLKGMPPNKSLSELRSGCNRLRGAGCVVETML